MYIKVNAVGRVCAAALNGILPDGIETAIPEGFELENHGDWRMENGRLVHDPRPEPEPLPTPMEQLQAEVAALQTDNTAMLLALADMIGGTTNGA